MIAQVEPGLPTRLNDGRCDRNGNFVFGTLHEEEPKAAIGAFYRLNAADLRLERLALRPARWTAPCLPAALQESRVCPKAGSR